MGQNSERCRRQTTTKVTAENVKSSCLIHLAHYFFPFLSESAERKTHCACHGFLTSFWVYIFLSGSYSLITASSSQLRRQTSMVPSLPLSPLLPSGLPPSLLVIFWRFWKVLPHSFYNPPPFKQGNTLCVTCWNVSTTAKTWLLKTLFICSAAVQYSEFIFLCFGRVVTTVVFYFERKWLTLELLAWRETRKKIN